MESLKTAIFENTIRRELIGEEATVDSFAENYEAYAEKFGRKGLNAGRAVLEYFGIGESGGAFLRAGSFLTANRMIICIDDLERKGGNLEIRDVMGLASFLKEEQHCKVVFLLNDGEKGTEDYFRYKEKVVDTELLFEPTSEECCAIAIDQSQPRLEIFAEYAATLGIRNIRVLKKIERLVRNSESMTSGMLPAVDQQLIMSLTVFGYSWYCSKGDDDVPSMEFVRSFGAPLFGLEQDEQDPKEAKWKDWLRSCNYNYTDELDLAVADSIEWGFFDEEKLLPLLETRNEQLLAHEGADRFGEAWSLYHNTFDDNTDEFVEALLTAFREDSKYISPRNLNSTMHFMKELDQAEAARTMLDFWIDAHDGNAEAFQTQDLILFDKPLDEELRGAFERKQEELKVEVAPIDVLTRLVSTDGWSQSDEAVLAAVTVDGYYEMFKSFRDERLSSVIRRCLQFGGGNEARDTIVRNAKSALRRLAEEGGLNEFRARKFGVSLEQDD